MTERVSHDQGPTREQAWEALPESHLQLAGGDDVWQGAMNEPRFAAASRDALARGLCDYWDPDDEGSRARLGYPCEPCKQEADWLLEQGIVQVAEEPRSNQPKRACTAWRTTR